MARRSVDLLLQIRIKTLVFGDVSSQSLIRVSVCNKMSRFRIDRHDTHGMQEKLRSLLDPRALDGSLSLLSVAVPRLTTPVFYAGIAFSRTPHSVAITSIRHVPAETLLQLRS